MIGEFLGTNDFPLIEPGAATFAWRGQADSVGLLRFIASGAGRIPFERVPGTDLWLLRVDVEDAGRFEYKLVIGHPGGEEWVVDALNPARAEDPFGQNSVCRTCGYARPDWSEPRGAPAGRIEEIAIDSVGFGTRLEHVYLPPGYDPGGAIRWSSSTTGSTTSAMPTSASRSTT